MEKGIEFINSLGTDDNVILIFHNDADGIASATLFTIFLKKHIGVDPYLISQPMPLDKNLIQKIKTSIPTNIIFLDLAVDQDPEMLKKISGFCSILIIDHHKINKNMNNETIVHANPRFDNPEIYQSNSYIVYRILSEITDMENYLWIAGIGMVGDYDLSDSMDIVEKIKEKYPDISKDPLLESGLAMAVDMISATRATKKLSSEEIVRILEGSESISDLMDNKDVLDSYRKIETEIAGVMVDFEKASESFKNMILYSLKSQYNLRSPVSTKVSEMFPDKLIILYQTVGGRIKISARNQSERFDVSNILKRSAKGLDASSSGGHANAGGATIKKDDWDIFRKRLIKITSEQK